MTHEEMRQSIREAATIIAQARQTAIVAINVHHGDLRGLYLDTDTLISIKKQLADFNIATGRWKK